MAMVRKKQEPFLVEKRDDKFMTTEKYQYMTLEQRKEIKKLLVKGETPSKISEWLGVHMSTVYREIRRGCDGKPCNKESNYINYNPLRAQEIVTENMKKRGKNLKKVL